MSTTIDHSPSPANSGVAPSRAITVTGSQGLVGQAVVAELRARGHRVTTFDLRVGSFVSPTGSERALAGDVCDAGDVVDALDGADTVVHLAGIPGSRMASDGRTFGVNVNGTYNVFRMAARLGVRRVVWASTESVFGVPFGEHPPAYLPIDEEHPRLPRTAYATSKIVCEGLADLIASTSDTSFVGLRLVHVMSEEDYSNLPEYWAGATGKSWDLWSYVDLRDVASAVASAVEVELSGATCALISAADTVSPAPTLDLVHAAFADRVPVRPGLEGNAAAFSTGYAKQLLGFEPRHSWRDHLADPGPTEGL